IFLERGYVTEKQLLEALSKRMELEFVDLKNHHIDPDAVEKLPRQIAERYNLIAIGLSGGALVIAMSDPLNFYAVEDVRQIARMQVTVVLATADEIREAIERQYAEIDAKT
ncbi:MAG: type II secretion system protein GspE, partial [Clostridia bacterium]|nr:type II secretion system protein GspE [Clostridia bacterium]